jgi:hypothetical protein
MEHDQEWAQLILRLDSVANRLQNYGYHSVATAMILYAQQDGAEQRTISGLISEGERILEAIA